MLKFKFLFTIVVVPLISFCQVNRIDLRGEWRSKNDSNLFYDSDTIIFHQNINHFHQNEYSCHQILWNIKGRKFKTSKLNNCNEPGLVSELNVSEIMKIKKEDFGQTLTVFQDKKEADKFRLLNFTEKQIQEYPHEIKELSLMRFDKLEEEKLYKYVDSLIFKVLNFKPEEKIKNESKLKIRHFHEENPEPPIILNGYPIENRDILKNILLVETYEIQYLTKKQATAIYGARSTNGIILLKVSRKRMKKVHQVTKH